MIRRTTNELSHRRFGRAAAAALASALAAGSLLTVARPPVASAVDGGFTALTPARILDTRTGLGSGSPGPLSGGSTITVKVTGVGGVPSAGVTAVVMNLTVDQPSAATFVTLWPADRARPEVSNINVGANQTRANLVTVAVPADGRVNIFNLAGSAHVILDVAGYIGGQGDVVSPLAPRRILDTRLSLGSKPPPGSAFTVGVLGVGGIPQFGVTAVVLNVTVTETEGKGHLTVWPSGQEMPNSSTLNYDAGQNVPNLAVVKVGAGGGVNFATSQAAAHVIFDVAGYIGVQGLLLSPVPPQRIVDSRPSAKLAPNQLVSYRVAGLAGLPPNNTYAVVLNVTVTEPTADGFLTVFPAADATPETSNLNFRAGQSVANQVLVKVGINGLVSVLNSSPGTTHVIFDVAGFVFGTTPIGFVPGVYKVSTDIPPGTYRTRINQPGCTWKRLRTTSGLPGDVIASDTTDGTTIVTIRETDGYFELGSTCPPLSSDLSPVTASPVAPFGPGTYLVGTDISPGRWRGSGGPGCVWTRLSGFSGTQFEVIFDDITGQTSPEVTIEVSDKGFDATAQCGTWTKVA